MSEENQGYFERMAAYRQVPHKPLTFYEATEPYRRLGWRVVDAVLRLLTWLLVWVWRCLPERMKR